MLLMLDTGQRTALSVNLDWLDDYELGEQLKLNGFLGGVAGGLSNKLRFSNAGFKKAARGGLQRAALCEFTRSTHVAIADRLHIGIRV